MIKATNLTKTFGKFTAVDNLSCQIKKGCIYGLVGSNGAGKSTFLRMVTGVYKPNAGTITINDLPVFNNPEAKKLFAYVPDELYFIPEATINRMAKLYASVYESFDMERCKTLTEAFKLNPKASINSFSKGMKRQAAIILALSCRTEYLFFDETFDGLDPVMRSLVKRLICQDVIEKDTTVIITSHSLRELEDICDQLALLHKGGLVLENDVDNLKTERFKVQIGFSHDFDESIFKDIQYTKYKKLGSVASMIIKGDKDATYNTLKQLSPVLLDMLPLTLEEVFTYEMEALGYDFTNILKEEQ